MTSGYLTHELRAPLTAIRCSLEIFLNNNPGTLKSEDQHLLDIALRNISKLNVLINDILELSKIQTGRLTLYAVPSDPVKLVRETAEDLVSWVKRAGLTLTVNAPEKCPQVLIDSRRTAQALTNLLSNAIKFTPSGGSIEISLEEGKEQRAGFVVVSVKDTGCGIAPEDIRKVFGYFVQVGSPEKRREGSGLGLSIARSMMEIQGGNMWVTSRAGEGSNFIFTLPVCQPPADGPAENGAAPAPAQDPSSSL